MRVSFDWGQLNIVTHTNHKIAKGEVYGFYHEEYNLPTIVLDMHEISQTKAPDSVLPGVVNELTPGSVLVHELCHYSLQYGEANKKARLTPRQEEIVCDAVSTLFSHLFHKDITKILKRLETDRPLDARQRKQKKEKK